MSAQEDQTRKRLLVCDEDMLNKLGAQLATAKKDVSFYEREIAKHQRTLAALRDWISDAETRAQQLQLSVARQNEELTLHGRGLPFPPEILGYIFEQLTHEPDPKWEDVTNLRTAFNYERARCPFNLAAVCRRWRQIALATSSIWHYVGVPSLFGLAGGAESHEQRILLHVERSGSAPLDILFESIDSPAYLAHLYPHAARWRRLVLTFNGRTSPSESLNFLRAPTPLLEDLALIQDDGVVETAWNSSSPVPIYLPSAPRLKALLSVGVPFALRGEATMPRLVACITKWSDISSGLLLSTLRACHTAHSMTILVARIHGAGNTVSSSPIQLQDLDALTMSSSPLQLLGIPDAPLSLPSLTTLSLTTRDRHVLGDLYFELLERFLQSVSDTLESLTVMHTNLTDDAIRALGAAARITSLSLLDCVSTSVFFESMTDLWPRLAALHFRGAGLSEGDCDALIATVIQRQADVEESTEPPPVRIERITFDARCTVPLWHRAELQRLTA